MIPGSINGIDVVAMLDDAKALASGQKTAYLQDLVDQIGVDPVFTVVVGGVQVYKSVMTGSLSVVDESVTFPTQFETPTINLANALTDESARIVVENAADSTKNISFTVNVGGVGNVASASGALDGIKEIASSIVLRAPIELLGVSAPPPAPSGSPTISVATFMNRMTTVSQNPIWGEGPAAQAACICPPHYAGVQGVCTYNPSATTTFWQHWDRFTIWLWFYRASGDTAVNKRLKFRNLKHSIFRSSTQQWENFATKQFSADQFQFWNRRTEMGSSGSGYDFRQESDGTFSARITGDLGLECWPADFYLVNDRAKTTDTLSFGAICEVCVINDDGTPYTGTDAKYAVNLGYDLYGPNTPAPDGRWTHPTRLDGGCARWVHVSGADGWTPIAVIPMDECYKHDGPAPPPIGDYTGSWAYNRYPYVFNEPKLRANLPGWMTL